MKFFCLQVVEFYLKTGYHQASAENQQFVKLFLSRLLQQQVLALYIYLTGMLIGLDNQNVLA